jgi:hypothetical protein
MAPAKPFFPQVQKRARTQADHQRLLSTLVPALAKETCEFRHRPKNPLQNLAFSGVINRALP